MILTELSAIINLIIIQFKQIFPYWFLGTVAGSFLSVYAMHGISSVLLKFRDDRYHFATALIFAVLGVASPICMYGTIPLVISLYKKGAPQYLLATFMVSSILLNPNLLILSFTLGAGIAFYRLLCCIAAGLLAGLLVKLSFRGKSLFSANAMETKENDCSAKKKSFFKDLHKSITITAPYFLVGIILTAILDRYFPREFIITAFGRNKALGILFAASLGVPVYVCGGGTIPLLKLWLQQGMSVGSATAFMLSGPATKITNLGAVKIILGLKNFIFYIALSMIFAILMGYLGDVLSPILK